MRQLGNAVPVNLARKVFSSVGVELLNANYKNLLLTTSRKHPNLVVVNE